jgi:hypothetical protein
MRQAVLIGIVVAIASFSACGGGGSSTTTTAPDTVTVSPATLSLNQTDVAGVTATLLDSTGAPASNPKGFAYTSDTPTVATVNPTSGAICAGVWDNSYIVCSAGQVGTAKITATSGGVSSTATVYVHKKVDRVVITSLGSACKSVGQTLQMTATAYSNGTDVTSTVGPFNWVANVADVATIDTTGLVTAHAPGISPVYANVSNVTSTPVNFTTCGVQSIHVHVSGSTDTAFSLATSATQQLQADVVDTIGNTITPTLTWFSTNANVATIDSTGKVTAVTPGTTSIDAECVTGCNYNIPPVYGNVVVPTVTGASATSVYVTGTGTTQLIPIDTTANTAGTAITLPSAPNSFKFLPGTKTAFLGSAGGLITLDGTTNTVSQNTAIPGKVLAVSPNANYVVVADASTVYVQSGSAGGSASSLAISGATAAAFSPDSSLVYIAAGSTLYEFQAGTTNLTSVTLTAPINDVGVLPSGAYAFLAGGSPHAVLARTTCDNSGAGTYIAPGTPTALRFTPDASTVIATDSPYIDLVTRTSLAQPGCPPPLQASLSSIDLGQGAFTPTGFVLSTDGTTAYISSDLGKIIAFNVSAKTASAIPLAGGATGLAEGLTNDGAKLYVGGSDNAVHRIDSGSGADAQQISVPFKPDLVAVKPQ